MKSKPKTEENPYFDEASKLVSSSSDVAYILETVSTYLCTRIKSSRTFINKMYIANYLLGTVTEGSAPFIIRLKDAAERLRQVEDQYLKSLESYTFSVVDTSGLPKPKAEEHLQSSAKVIRDSINTDHMLVIPISQGRAGSTCEVRRGNAVTLDMVDYFRKKLYQCGCLDANGNVMRDSPILEWIANDIVHRINTTNGYMN